MATPNKQVIIEATIKLIEAGKSWKSSSTVICGKFRFSTKTFDKYWKIANQEHIERQQVINEQLRKAELDNAIAERKAQLADIAERKGILTQIARGLIQLTKPMVVDGMLQQIDVVPDWMDRKNAIAELNKMDGAYAPTKIANTDTDGNNVVPTPSIIKVIPGNSASIEISESE